MLVPVQGNPIVYRLNCPGSGCQSVISEWMAILGNLYLRTRWASGLFSIKIVVWMLAPAALIPSSNPPIPAKSAA